ncbi:hypothetical protein MNQ96_02975 [Sphingopyxis granuli]|uniref:hypothetical protein n=1 Tax=Sphingopyxis granuli TaxID=267128 RepID=UPI001F537CCE|nr:hypothetical protein [Sphingopyxis granuli]UNK80071.1 hypothetical protein MNQ96_02975 [Sphingopyxis granuli]
MIAAAMPKTPQSARHGDALKLHRDCGFGEVSISPHQPQSLANPPIVRTGTALAIKYLTSGVAALFPSSTGRGGARNRADRESHALTVAQIANLKAAERHAEKIGLPFTRMISIHWQAAGLPLAGMAKATGRFTDLMAKALARHGSGTAWLWVHENVPGNSHDKGGHCHLLAHVPADLVSRLTALQRGWLRRITGQPYQARVIHSKPIGGRLGLEAGNPDLHAVNLEVALAYVLKGASPEAASQFGLERLEAGGCIIGKRCGTSQNIGAKARKAKD